MIPINTSMVCVCRICHADSNDKKKKIQTAAENLGEIRGGGKRRERKGSSPTRY